MSSLFHRRTRSAPAQRPQTPVSSSAHLAASQAFLASQTSQSNLSASAAAAALRAMSPPPTQVGEVQTKRMQRRSSSASLSHSPRGRSTGGVQRQSSSGSMTERTFRRSPSPGRPVSQGGPEPAPPVPKLPQDIPTPPPFSTKAQRRAASLETPHTRVYSPASRSFVPTLTPSSPSPQAAQKAAAAPGAGASKPPNELQRSDSRNSINFSYPRPSSPPVRSPTSPTTESQMPQTLRNAITPAQAETAKYDVARAAQQPVKKKKKKAAPRSVEGSHLQSGTMGIKPVTTPLEPGPDLPPQPPPQPVKKKKKKVVATGQSTHFPSDTETARQESDSDSATDTTKRAQRASGVLMKQPSIVREDWEGEQEQERSEAQTREEQGLSPISSPSTIQSKKTTAANMSRKIEEPPAQPKQPAAPAYHAVTTDERASPVSPPPAQEQYLAAEQPQPRTSSISPSRSTRFSDHLSSDLAAGKKHQPLPRSVSPVKSALKHHSQDAPPVDPRAQRVRDSSATPSDASDSNLSADGSVRRKKSARVSFEPAVEIVGTAAESQDTGSPAIASPQHKDTGKRGFFGLGRTKPGLATIPSEEDIEEHMKPRPQLPSFGSIRSKTRQTDSSESIEAAPSHQSQRVAPLAATGSSASSESSSSANPQAMDQGVSSDHAIGGVLAQEVASQAARFSTYAPALAPAQRDPSLPLPPEVTSVEGTGYVSDTESDSSDEETSAVYAPEPSLKSAEPILSAPAPETAQAVPATARTPASVAAPATEVPAVAVQPPTPSVEQTNPADQWQVEVPGGFPVVGEELSKTDSSNESKPSDVQQQVSPSGLGIAERPPIVAKAVETVNTQPAEESEEETTDNASIYSDAAEDLSDLEGDGFGSINAIVESPIVDSPRLNQLTTPPQSPLGHAPQRPTESARTASWDETQQQWSGFVKQTQENVQQSSTKTKSGGLEDSKWATAPAPLSPVSEMQAKPKKKKKRTAAATAAALAPAASMRQPLPDSPPRAKNQSSAYPVVEARKGDPSRTSGSFRQSMRTQPVAQPQPQLQGGFRSSLRSQPAVQPDSGFRKSMRGAPQPARPKSPPQAIAVQSSPPRAALQKKHIPSAVTAQPRPAPASQTVQKSFSNDSDSESSFQKSRRSKPNASGTYSMRHSMRASTGPQGVPAQSAGQSTGRPLSPPQRRPFSPVGEPKAFRSTMRNSFDTGTPTLRNQPEAKRSSSLFGRRKAKSPSPAKPGPIARGIQSRIKDSDDEDEPRRTTFRSRFQDSSDDEADQTAFRPVRGIPRRADEGDSTDLEDSSDEEQKAPKAKPQPPRIITSPPASTVRANAPVSPTSPTKKKGLFSRFRSKKEKDDSSQSRLGVGTAVAVGAAKEADKDEDMDNMGFGSTAERDEMIRQTMAKLEAAKQAEQEQPSSPAGGKIQRRGMGERIMSDSWPLPEKSAPTEDGRPSTSTGVPAKTNGTAIRPGMGERTPTSETDGSTAAYGRSGKKKRFPMLRKAFGLKD